MQVVLNESIVDRVSPGLRAVRFEALPNLVLKGASFRSARSRSVSESNPKRTRQRPMSAFSSA